MENPASQRIEVIRHGDGTAVVADWVASEEPLEIRVKGRSVAVTMRTPGHDRELACGFLVTEGLLNKREDVIEIAPCQTDAEGNILNVFVAPSVTVNFEALTRHVFGSSSCGLCGKATIESVHQRFPPAASRLSCAQTMICSLPGKLRSAQKTFETTGGLHAAAIFNSSGDLLALYEDVGRHNAVDKLIGWGFLESLLPFDNHVLLVSGRASFEIMQKALAAGIPIVAAVSAPSSLAVDFAVHSNQTLIGFLRGATFNTYSHSHRIR